MSGSEKQDDNLLIKLIKVLVTPVLIALVAGGTSPWWWPKVAGEGGERCKIIVWDEDELPTNVRADASVKARVLGTLTDGTELNVKENQPEWLVIEYDGGIGYIYKNLTKEQCY